MSEKTSEKIIALMSENKNITISEMSEKIGVSQRSIERNIEKLQKEGRIERIGPAKGGYWQVLSDD
ncbi:MAG: HTH domain-containing protein [Spirochaetes bacterium]|nr:HTH domain-containing protein [Spirochaetota bacterium]